MASPQEQTLRIGLLGLGVMGQQHLAGYAEIPGVDVVTRDAEPYRLYAPEDREALYAAMIADSTLDALDLCLPTPLHARLTIAALQAGKHVLCEKPMALNAADCDAMMRAAEASGRILMIAHVLRFASPYRLLKEAVRAAPFGALQHLELMRSSGLPDWAPWLSDPAQSGGAVLDLLVHDFDQAIFLAGSPVQVEARPLAATDDFGSRSASWSSWQPTKSLTHDSQTHDSQLIETPQLLRGTASAIACTLGYGDTSSPVVDIAGGWYADERPFSMGYRARFATADLVFSAGKVYLHRPGEEAMELPLQSGDMYTEQLRYFVECVRSGQQPHQCPPSAAAAAVALAIAAREQALQYEESTKA